MRSTETSMKHSQSVDDETDEHQEQPESFSDVDSDAEIHTAVPVVARARVVEVPKRAPPALPPRNPGRVASPTSPTPPADGFDRISLNDATEEKHEDLHKLSPTTTHENTEPSFHSVPVTPNEERRDSRDLPGSFQ